MASRLQVNNIIKESGSGDVAFAYGGAIFNGDLTVQNATFDNISSVLSLGQYTNATRPANPTQGTIIYNVSVGQVQIWNGDRWVLLDTKGGTLPEVGQVVHLDATKTSSYSGGASTIWTDLSGNGNNFSIDANAHQGTAGSKLAYMAFINDTNGCAKNSGDISLDNEVTYVVVTRILNSTSTWRTLTRSYNADHHVIVQSGAWNIGMYDNNGSGFIDSGANQNGLSNYISNSWATMIWRFSNTDDPTYEMFVNGEKVGEIRNSNARYNRGFGSIGAYHDGNTNPNSSSQYWGDIRLFVAYNRRITNDEIVQCQYATESQGYLQN
tara:strand:+ start:1466 stop:2437 length:972 start_codon:yes stop_codon:yes gene_type:complete